RFAPDLQASGSIWQFRAVGLPDPVDGLAAGPCVYGYTYGGRPMRERRAGASRRWPRNSLPTARPRLIVARHSRTSASIVSERPRRAWTRTGGRGDQWRWSAAGTRAAEGPAARRRRHRPAERLDLRGDQVADPGHGRAGRAL